jgi:hypothetical protein
MVLNDPQMTFIEIRNVVIRRMTTQTAIAQDAVDYPNGPVFDPGGRKIWARLTRSFVGLNHTIK